MTDSQRGYQMLKSAKQYVLHMSFKNWSEELSELLSEASDEIMTEARYAKEFINYSDAYEYASKWAEFSYYVDSLRRKVVDTIYECVR